MCSKQNGARAETQAEAEDLIDEIKSDMNAKLRRPRRLRADGAGRTLLGQEQGRFNADLPPILPRHRWSVSLAFQAAALTM
jgi:hypothetical protein